LVSDIGSYLVRAEGFNKYGVFTMTGTARRFQHPPATALDSDHEALDLELFRHYDPTKPIPKLVATKEKSASAPSAARLARIAVSHTHDCPV
jgi:hypothetical protein